MGRAGVLETAAIGREAWPAIPGTAEAFAEELEERGLADLTPERAAEVYLAWACGRGEPAAIAAFEERHGADMVAFARNVRIAPDVQSDVLQQVRERILLGGPGRPPRIAQYGGRGELRGWLRVTVVRIAVTAARRLRRGNESETPLEELAAPAIDLDAALTRARCGDAFRAAFTDALAALEPRDRSVLRYRYIDRLTDEEIARIYQYHRVSVTRRVASARRRLLSLVRSGLRERLGLASDEVSSVIRAVRSQIAVTLSALSK